MTNETADLINGIAIYDETDLDERQEFIWHKTENEVPLAKSNILIEKILSEKWHNVDEITKDIAEIESREFDNKTKNRIEYELFEINIRMVDKGEETDSNFVHY